MSIDFGKLREMVEADSNINDSELDIESLKIPQLHSKYLNIYTDEKLELSALEFKYNEMLRLKWEYYTGKMSQEELEKIGWEPFHLNILKQDLNKYLDADTDLFKLKAKMVYKKEKLDYIMSTIKGINTRQFHIRDAIAWRKFINGMN